MDDPIGFEFPVDPSDQWDGFNDAGMEHFTGSPFAGLGREVSQNVLDALDQEPARMVVRLTNVDTASIPNVDELRATLEACKAAPNESDKSEIFFNEALQLLGQAEDTGASGRGLQHDGGYRPVCQREAVLRFAQS